MKIVSFYTTENGYKEVYEKNLKPGLIKYNLEYEITAVKNISNWYSGQSFKSSFILDRLSNLKEDLIWIDVDATIEKKPKLLYEIPKEYDIAVFFLDWFKMWRNEEGGKKMELISATMMFRYNEKVLKLVKKWKEECNKNTGLWDQRVLQKLLEEDNTLKVYKLPPEYCAIVLHNNELPKYIKEPVLIQHQASRNKK